MPSVAKSRFIIGFPDLTGVHILWCRSISSRLSRRNRYRCRPNVAEFTEEFPEMTFWTRFPSLHGYVKIDRILAMAREMHRMFGWHLRGWLHEGEQTYFGHRGTDLQEKEGKVCWFFFYNRQEPMRNVCDPAPARRRKS